MIPRDNEYRDPRILQTLHLGSKSLMAGQLTLAAQVAGNQQDVRIIGRIFRQKLIHRAFGQRLPLSHQPQVAAGLILIRLCSRSVIFCREIMGVRHDSKCQFLSFSLIILFLCLHIEIGYCGYCHNPSQCKRCNSSDTLFHVVYLTCHTAIKTGLL